MNNRWLLDLQVDDMVSVIDHNPNESEALRDVVGEIFDLFEKRKLTTKQKIRVIQWSVWAFQKHLMRHINDCKLPTFRYNSMGKRAPGDNSEE